MKIVNVEMVAQKWTHGNLLLQRSHVLLGFISLISHFFGILQDQCKRDCARQEVLLPFFCSHGEKSVKLLCLLKKG